jgi:hypothetical protein
MARVWRTASAAASLPVPMDLFLAGCQGLGLALAAGIFAGAAGRRGAIGVALLAAAVIGGAIVFGASLAAEDHPAWPGWPIGALAAWLAFAVARDVAEGAGARDGGGAAGALIALGALVLAALCLFVSPVALLALAAVVWLAVSRRARAARKYEGLRTLR